MGKVSIRRTISSKNRKKKKRKTLKVYNKVTTKSQLLASFKVGRPSPWGSQARLEALSWAIFHEGVLG